MNDCSLGNCVICAFNFYDLSSSSVKGGTEEGGRETEQEKEKKKERLTER